MREEQKIGLGTVQFGLPYGIANARGRVPRGEAAAILAAAADAGVCVLDTTPGYGESERLLGRLLARDAPFSIVTKTAASGSRGEDAAREIRAGFEASLSALGADAVYGLLEHRPERLVGDGGDRVFEALAGLRDAGRVQRIGVSVYTPEQADAILSRHAIDLVQLPLSVFDQRLVRGGQLGRLRAAGVEIHARSSLLQGVAAMEPAALPEALRGLRPALERLRELAREAQRSPVSAALAFVCDLPEVDVVLCGVQDRRELQELLAASRQPIAQAQRRAFEEIAVDDPALVDPSKWWRAT